MLKSGDVILTKIQFTDYSDIKIRPALVLFEELNNIVVAGITSNLHMKGIPLTKDEGALTNSVIKPNYIFTISNSLILKKLFCISSKKKRIVYKELKKRIKKLKK